MSTYEHDILQQYKDESGNIHVLYPVTKSENVDGIDKYAQTMEMNQAIASRVSVSEFNSSVAAIRTGLATKPDYEVGTFSPYIMNGGITPKKTQAEYTKVGSMVYIEIKLTFDSAVGTANIGGILGLPFAVETGNATGGYYPVCGKTVNGCYTGLASFDNYMGSVPSIGTSDIFGSQSTKYIRLSGYYKTTA